MTPTKFDQQTHEIATAHGDTPLMFDPISGLVVVRYQATPKELEQMNANGGKLFLALAYPVNQPYPVMGITPELEFREATQEEKDVATLRMKKAIVRANAEKRKSK